MSCLRCGQSSHNRATCQSEPELPEHLRGIFVACDVSPKTAFVHVQPKHAMSLAKIQSPGHARTCAQKE